MHVLSVTLLLRTALSMTMEREEDIIVTPPSPLSLHRPTLRLL